MQVVSMIDYLAEILLLSVLVKVKKILVKCRTHTCMQTLVSLVTVTWYMNVKQ